MASGGSPLFMITTKYYHATNCNRSIVAGRFALNFTPYEHVGTWMGIYATSDPAQIEALDALVKTRKLDALTETEYATCLKKKQMVTGDYSGSLAATAPTPGEVALSAAPTGASTQPPLAPGNLEMTAPPPLATVEDAITPVPVQPKTTISLASGGSPAAAVG